MSEPNSIDTILNGLRDQLIDAQKRTERAAGKGMEGVPKNDMSDFQRDVLNDIHTIAMQITGLTRHINRIETEAEQKVAELDGLVNDRFNEFATQCEDMDDGIAALGQRIYDLKNFQPVESQELSAIFSRLNLLEGAPDHVDTWHQSYQALNQGAKENTDNIETLIIEQHQQNKRIAEVVESAESSVNRINNAQKYVGTLNSQVECNEKTLSNLNDLVVALDEKIENFREYLAETPVYNEPLVLHQMSEAKHQHVINSERTNRLQQRIDDLEQAVFTQSVEPKESQIERGPSMTIEHPYKYRLAQNLSEGNLDLQNEMYKILDVLYDDDIKALMTRIRIAVDRHDLNALLIK